MAHDDNKTDPGAVPPSGERRPPDPPDGDIQVIDRRWWARAAAGDATDATDVVSNKPSYVQEIEQRLASKDEELRATIGRYRDANAEFEQARARFRRDVAKEVERGKRAILADLLEVLDNLDRAIEAAQPGASGGALVQGVEMVRRQFLDKFASFGVARLDVLGQPFDPNTHEAAAAVPTSDPGQNGIVVGVIRSGYAIGNDLLRPAVVAVARLTTEGAAS